MKDNENESAKTAKGTAIAGGRGDRIALATVHPLVPVTAHLLAPVTDVMMIGTEDVRAHHVTVDDARAAAPSHETRLSTQTIIELPPLDFFFY